MSSKGKQVRRIQAMKDPFVFARTLWPEVTFYREQREIIRSVQDTPETFVVAGNMLGLLPLTI